MHNILNFKKIKNYNYLNLSLYFLPIAIIIGNSVINLINLILFILLTIEIIKKNKSFFIKYKNYLNFFIFFSIIFFLNIFFSVDKAKSIISFIGFFGHFVIMLAIIYAIDKDINFSKNFFKIIFLVLVFVGLDTLFQYFNEKDIFGFKIDEGHGRRLSGPFGDEYIVGSYMCKFFFLSLLFFEEKNLKYFKSFLIVAFLMLIVLTNERAASIMFFISTIIYLLLNNEFSIKEKCLGFLIFLTLLISLFSLNKNLKNHFFDRTFEQIGITQTNKISHNNFLDSQWGAHFLTSIEIYKNNKFWGSGIKTFRKECANENYSTIKTAEVKSRCNTHPHNIYLEILSETGLIGFIPFICIIFYLSARILKNLFFNSKSYNKNLIIGLSFFILFNPFQTTGAFFSTWNGSFYWIIIPFVIRINNVFLKTKETQQYG